MRVSIVVAMLLLAACRGEPVPRDYQNAPPDMTHPPDSKKDAPSTSGMGQATPEPTTGVEGTAGPYKEQTPPPQPTTTTMPDTPPVTTS
ncbi:MAG: hypothetical protein ACLGH0_01555 [Thermoanaerobaculia bacterium]